MKKGSIEVQTQNIFPVIKKWLYSDKDIFLRELTVNACDAITKIKKLQSIGECKSDDTNYRVDIYCDKENKTITIKDNGIGMTEEEIDKYINQIAFSGAEEFLAKYKDKDEKNQIIGHFGLGFYSAYMVADLVEIETKSYKDEPAVKWTCDGGTEYEISESSKTDRGTIITLHVSDAEEEFLQAERLRSVLLKYCAFLPYPIHLNDEEKSVNDTNPLWTKSPADCKEEEYKELYHRLFSDYNDPLFWIHLNVDYPFNLKGILYFPKLTHEFESAQGQIKLFNNQVFVADNIKEVIPEFLMLLKGVIDCPEIPLNVSRSSLQNDGYVNKISSHITKKVADKIISLHKLEKEHFDEYYDDISPFIEYGCMRDEKLYDKLKPVLQVKTTLGEFVSLSEYAEAQDKNITYISNENQQAQYIKMLKEEGRSAIIMPHIIDTHFINFLEMKEQWKFTRIDTLPQETKDDESIVEVFKNILSIDDLKITASSLKISLPAIIVEDEQERRINDMTKMFGNAFTKQKYTLVLNTDSEIINKIEAMEDANKKELVCKQIYDIARVCHNPLTTEEMTEFIERSSDILKLIM